MILRSWWCHTLGFDDMLQVVNIMLLLMVYARGDALDSGMTILAMVDAPNAFMLLVLFLMQTGDGVMHPLLFVYF